MKYFVSALSGLLFMLSLVLTQGVAQAQDLTRWQANLTQPQSYVLKRVSSTDPTGGNADFRFIEPGATLTVRDHPDAPPTTIPRSEWQFARDENGAPLPDRNWMPPPPLDGALSGARSRLALTSDGQAYDAT